MIRKMGVSPTALPIIALTANAFEDQRAAYLSAGMQDVLTKPLRLDELRAMLRRYGPSAAGDPQAAVTEGPTLREAASDAPALEEAVVGQLFATLPKEAFEALLERLSAEKIRLVDAAIASRDDPHRLPAIGHELKGMLASFGLKAAAEAAARIETEILTPDEVDIQIEEIDASFTAGMERIRVRLQDVDRLSEE